MELNEDAGLLHDGFLKQNLKLIRKEYLDKKNKELLQEIRDNELEIVRLYKEVDENGRYKPECRI